MSTHYVTIKVQSENSANILKEQIEKAIPLVEGNVQIFKEPEIQSLDKIIEEMRKKN